MPAEREQTRPTQPYSVIGAIHTERLARARQRESIAQAQEMAGPLGVRLEAICQHIPSISHQDSLQSTKSTLWDGRVLYPTDIPDESGPIKIIIYRRGSGGVFGSKQYRIRATDFPSDLVITVVAVTRESSIEVDDDQSHDHGLKKREADMNDVNAWEDVFRRLEAKFGLEKPASQPPSQ